MTQTLKQKIEEILLQKLGEPISDNPPNHLEFKDVHNGYRIKIVVTEILQAFRECVPENKQGIKYHSGRQNCELSAFSPADNQKVGFNQARQEMLRRIEE